MKNKIKGIYKTFSCCCGNVMQILCFSELQGEENNQLNCAICLFCHVITTGEDKIIDDSGKLEKFMTRWTISKQNMKK